MLEIKNLRFKHLFGATAFSNINFTAEKGKIFCIYGKSESGKTSLLKTIAGLNKPSDGTIFFNNILYNNMPISERNIFLLHEDFGFFENKTVFFNMAYPLKIRDTKNEIILNKIKVLAGKYSYSDFLNIKIKKLSMENRLRIALSRSELRKADIYIFDNPFSCVLNREILFDSFLPTLKNISKNSIVLYATDSLQEMERINENNLIINYGVAEQIGLIENIKYLPLTLFICQLFYPNATMIVGELLLVNNCLVLKINNECKKIDFHFLISKIYIGKKVCVMQTTKGKYIYDMNCEKIIYFDKII